MSPIWEIAPDSLSDFHTRLGSWYDRHARPLPWRDTHDPYHILLSEVILQQTRVEQGRAYYHRFLEAFPTIEALARATEDEVLLLWQGLGYYSRGRNLRRAAQIVVEDYGGQIPDTLRDVARLPGVGPYTQAAILSFAYDKPYAAVDGNVYRVLSRLSADETPIDTPQGQKCFRQMAQMLLDREHPGRHNQAMIELGATLCNPRSPQCLLCPVVDYCQAYVIGTHLSLPRKQGKLEIKDRYLHYFYVRITSGGQTRILLKRRGKGDIWQGLYEVPMIESSDPSDLDQLLSGQAWAEFSRILGGLRIGSSPLSQARHRLTHRLLHASLYLVEAEDYHPTPDSPYLCVPESEHEGYGMPILLRKLLSHLPD